MRYSIWEISVFTIKNESSRELIPNEVQQCLGEYRACNRMDNFRSGHSELLKLDSISPIKRRHFEHANGKFHLYLYLFDRYEPVYRWTVIGPHTKVKSPQSPEIKSPGVWNAFESAWDSSMQAVGNALSSAPDSTGDQIIYESVLTEANVPPPSNTCTYPGIMKISFNAEFSWIQMNKLIDENAMKDEVGIRLKQSHRLSALHKITNQTMVDKATMCVTINSRAVTLKLKECAVSAPQMETQPAAQTTGNSAKTTGLSLLNMVCIGIACTSIMLAAACSICMYKRHRRTKEIRKWNNVAASINPQRQSRLIKRVHDKKNANAVLRPRKWKAERFEQMIENADAVQNVIFDDILEEMHVEGIVKEEDTSTRGQECEGNDKTMLEEEQPIV